MFDLTGINLRKNFRIPTYNHAFHLEKQNDVTCIISLIIAMPCSA